MGVFYSTKKNRWLIYKILSIVFFAQIFFSCPTMAQLSNGKQAVAVGIANAYPFSYIDNQGKAAGLHIEIARMVAKKEGMDIEIKLMEWAEALEKLREEKVDFILGALPEDGRMWDFTKSNPHSNMEISFFALEKDSFSNLPEMISRSEIKVGICEMIADLASFKFLPTSTQAIIGDMESLFKLLLKKNVDMVFCPREMGAAFIHSHALQNVVVRPYPILNRKVCFAARGDRVSLIQSLNSGLSQLMDSKPYYDLTKTNQKKLSKKVPTKISIFDFILMSVLTLILITGYIYIEKKSEIMGKRALIILLLICLSIEVAFVFITYVYDKKIDRERVVTEMKTLANLNSMLINNRIKRVEESFNIIKTDSIISRLYTFARSDSHQTIYNIYDQVADDIFFPIRRKLEKLTQGWRRTEAFLMDNSGTILLSSNPMNDGDKNYISSLYQNDSQTVDEFQKFSINIYNSVHLNEAFIEFTTPVTIDSLESDSIEQIGAIALRVPLEEFLIPLQWELQSMGETGEILIFHNDGYKHICVNNSRFFPNINYNLSFPTSSSYGMGQLIKKAFKGNSGVASVKDYRGVNVIASFHPMAINSNNRLFAIIIKRDQSEAFLSSRDSLVKNIVII